MTDYNYRFSIIPGGAVTDKRLEPRDLQVLCLLGRHSDKGGWCYRSQTRMAREIDCSRSSIQRSLDRLYEAGWVQRELRQRGDVVPDAKHPYASHAYRVIFDHIVPAKPEDEEPDDDPNPTSQEPETPVENTGGVPTGGHPGAHHTWARGAHTYVGTNKEESEGPLLEQVERETRTRGKGQKKRDSLKALWPTGAIDDQAKIDREWELLPDTEHDGALDLAPVFLAEAKKNGRKYVPPLWKYLEQRNWKHLKPPKAEKTEGEKSPAPSQHPVDGEAGRALVALGRIMRHSPLILNNSVIYLGEITPRIRALATAPHPNDWKSAEKGSGNYAAWREFGWSVWPGKGFTLDSIDIPWEWPPRKDGSIISTTGADPPNELSDEDARALSGT